jgi:hypothetical protein
VGGKAWIVLFTREPLFLRRRDDSPVLDERRSAVMIKRG